jgi:hypothetical protein
MHRDHRKCICHLTAQHALYVEQQRTCRQGEQGGEGELEHGIVDDPEYSRTDGNETEINGENMLPLMKATYEQNGQ